MLGLGLRSLTSLNGLSCFRLGLGFQLVAILSGLSCVKLASRFRVRVRIKIVLDLQGKSQGTRVRGPLLSSFEPIAIQLDNPNQSGYNWR
jgi:hypothetical protein